MSFPADNPPPEVLFSMDALRRAWRVVRRSGPSAGSDGVKPREFGLNIKQQLRELRHEILTGVYVPRPVMRFYMKKPSGKERPLTIWAVRDRVAQRVVHDYLTSLLETYFLDCSYGFRPGRAPGDAIRAVVEARDLGYRWVLDADIESCFDSIPLGLLTARVRAVVPSRLARQLIKAWLHTPVSGWRHGVAGLSQGSVVSPQLANLYLHSFDEMLLAALPDARLVRFADDFVVLSRRKQQAHWSRSVAGRCLGILRLRLSADKTRIVHFDEGFQFLGFALKDNTVMCLSPNSGKEQS